MNRRQAENIGPLFYERVVKGGAEDKKEVRRIRTVPTD